MWGIPLDTFLLGASTTSPKEYRAEGPSPYASPLQKKIRLCPLGVSLFSRGLQSPISSLFLHLLPGSRCHRWVGGWVPPNLGFPNPPPSLLTGLGPTCPFPCLVVSTLLGRSPRMPHTSSVAQGGRVMAWVGHAPLLSKLPRARSSSPTSLDLQIGRLGRTPCWMVLHPAGIKVITYIHTDFTMHMRN